MGEKITYPINSEHMGDLYRGNDRDLADFIPHLAAVTGRPESDFVVDSRSRDDLPEWEISEDQWNAALDKFWAQRPELWAT